MSETYLLTCDDIHPARAESTSMALTASRTTADQARRSWARSIASDAHSLFHLRMPTTAGPMSRLRSSFSVVAQVFSCPPVRLRQIRGTPELISSRTNSPGARRTNEDGAATEALARLGAVDVGGELRRDPDRDGYTFRCGASNRCRRLRLVSCPPRGAATSHIHRVGWSGLLPCVPGSWFCAKSPVLTTGPYVAG